MLDNTASSVAPSSSSDAFASLENGLTNKRKRRLAGDVSLSPKTLLESDRYVCEICNQGFQRDQNLQMHRPWKLLKRETQEVRKRVFVCPEPSFWLHHDPACHALGNLVGIKKNFRRKQSNHKQWVCEKCSKGYVVQSDYKAHLKTCGTRGHPPGLWGGRPATPWVGFFCFFN
ncbi:LOW QUALITY PROTEIN: protein indeterminate-domain 14-like [Corylus avellana]|uniref:LOW QUALITY PROTEIN: protein indeterminate-domain 14-like n=1 Tax=Corylus avellana TaxID=13451 RepID=UPI00286D67EF|nr:LOW QUALITY PROTEIN: protein indeterminate-domain 14-like [Corylus avellana]